LSTTICVDLEDTSALSDVGEEMTVSKHIDRGLAVEENPMQWYEVILGLGESKLGD